MDQRTADLADLSPGRLQHVEHFGSLGQQPRHRCTRSWSLWRRAPTRSSPPGTTVIRRRCWPQRLALAPWRQWPSPRHDGRTLLPDAGPCPRLRSCIPGCSGSSGLRSPMRAGWGETRTCRAPPLPRSATVCPERSSGKRARCCPQNWHRAPGSARRDLASRLSEEQCSSRCWRHGLCLKQIKQIRELKQYLRKRF